MRLSEARKFRAQLEALGDTMSDDVLVTIPSLAHPWTEDGHYTTGYRVQYGGRLYKCRQDHDGLNDHNRAPDKAPALWELIAPPTEDGTQEHPITFDLGMAVENGKYYIDDGVLYLCIRDSGVPLFNRLADLIDNYVQRVN